MIGLWKTSAVVLLSTPWATTTVQAQTCPSLTWSDEFDGSALNSSVWTPQEGDGCDLGQNLCGWGNAEPQYYLGQNAEVSDGMLKIIAKRETVEGKEFTSARIRTFGNVELDLTKDTLIEARIKVPGGGKGIWPAFWLMPSPEVLWPSGGEIDIMEFIGREPYFGQGYIHYGVQYGDKSDLGGPMRFPEPLYEDFHVFSILKTTNRIAWMIDGHEFQSYTPDDIQPKYTWPFENTYYIILNVATGGFWPGYADDATVFPTQMEVDYVRVYDMADGKTVPLIQGTRLVHQGDAKVEYCVVNADGAAITWVTPSDATFVASSTTNCILVDFGSSSGYVKADVTSSCPSEGVYALSIPVEVQPYYGVESTLMDASTSLPVATGELSVGDMDGEQVLMYTRAREELYDNIQISSVLTNVSDFMVGQRKFFLEVKTTTSAPCTRIIVQLEDSTLVTTADDFIGRHSRYTCFLEPTTEWQRVACDYADQPDSSVTSVDRVVLLIDAALIRGDVYYFRSVDVSVAGCTSNCEALQSNGASTSNCRRAAKSEAGACADGVNDDYEGYNGNAVTDCEDPACYMLDPVCMETLVGAAAPVTSGPTTLSPTTSPPNATDATTSPPPTAAASTLAPTVSAMEAPTPSSPPSSAIFSGSAECSANQACVGLVDDCCPTADGVFLYCCFEKILEFGYEKDQTFVGPQVQGEVAVYEGSNSPYFVPATAPDGSSPVVAYDRGNTELYDLIYYLTDAITNASEYVSGDKKFFMDMYTTSNACVQVLLQFDSLPMARENDYPVGRHSRYVAFTTKSNEWERLEFTFLDRPDQALGDDEVNALVLFFDVGTLQAGKHFFRNLDSAKFGCDPALSSTCEVTEPKSCPALFNGEAETCNDGTDNDNDGLIDCADTECMESPECVTTVTRSYASVENLLVAEEASAARTGALWLSMVSMAFLGFALVIRI